MRLILTKKCHHPQGSSPEDDFPLYKNNSSLLFYNGGGGSELHQPQTAPVLPSKAGPPSLKRSTSLRTGPGQQIVRPLSSLFLHQSSTDRGGRAPPPQQVDSSSSGTNRFPSGRLQAAHTPSSQQANSSRSVHCQKTVLHNNSTTLMSVAHQYVIFSAFGPGTKII